MTKKIIDAKNAPDGTIASVRLSGNAGWTPAETAIRMADRGQIENAHTVRRANAKPHLRTNPDGKERNNLDYLAED